MKKMKKFESLPDNFQSIKESSDFWDDHDAGDYEEYLRPVSEELTLSEKMPYAVLLEYSIQEKLKKVAHNKGISIETLVNLWLKEKLQKIR